mgnify:CR=1 FL=1
MIQIPLISPLVRNKNHNCCERVGSRVAIHSFFMSNTLTLEGGGTVVYTNKTILTTLTGVGKWTMVFPLSLLWIQ